MKKVEVIREGKDIQDAVELVKVAKPENLLEKYNPYHDQKGRFSQGGGAHTVVPQGGVGRFSTALALQAHGHANAGYQTPFDTQEVVRERVELQGMLATHQSTHEINTPQRDALRQKAEDKLYELSGQEKYSGGQVLQNKQAFIVIGPPAAGKSSSMAEPLSRQHNARLIDSDDAKKLLPEYKGGKGAGVVHEESSIIAHKVRDRAINNGDNIVLPIVGKTEGSITGIRDSLKSKGYDVHLVLVDVNKQEATKRAIDRWKHTGRFVDPNYVYNGVGDRPSKNYDKLKYQFTSYSKYNNNVPKGTNPILVDSGTGKL
jgi:gluconate kinase